MKFIYALVGLLGLLSGQALAQPANTMMAGCVYFLTPPTSVDKQFTAVRCDATGALMTAPGVSAFSLTQTPITASAVGTTTAFSATLPAAAGKTTYLCGYDIATVATAAVIGTATITGTISGTLSFLQSTMASPTLSRLTVTNAPMCIPGSAVNTAIVINSSAPGVGGSGTISAWGYQQ